MSRKVSRASSPRTTPATAALVEAGIDCAVMTFDHDDKVRSYGAEAATHLGVEPASVLKTLVVQLDGTRFAVACLGVDAEADLKAVAAALDGKRAALAEEADVRRLTGYVLGGVSPIGQRTRLPTVIDAGATRFSRVHVSGGARGLEVALSPGDLVLVTKAVVAPITR